MHQQLPKEIDPFRFAHGGIQLSGAIAIASMRRLTAALVDSEGDASVAMRFDIDETGLPFMEGRFQCEVRIVCERCMKPMPMQLDIRTLLGIVRSEHKIEGLAEQYEPWVIERDNRHVDPAQIVEDELILALPIVPKHDYQCLPDAFWQAGETESEAEKPASPFAALSALKKQ